MLLFFPRDVLDEILNLIESVSDGFPSYSFNHVFSCINIRQVPMKVFQTRARRASVQTSSEGPANVNAQKCINLLYSLALSDP